ncbi:MAG: hypothetical protein IJU16_04005, partial [Clostridia bacterium]|nr:hypothetical protein [Clostridia bacterium]
MENKRPVLPGLASLFEKGKKKLLHFKNFSMPMRRWLIVGLCGLALIGIASWSSGRTRSEPQAITADTDTYIKNLEDRLEKLVSGISGAGRTRVMITLENDIEYVYATEQKVNSDHSESEKGGNVSSRDDSQKTVVIVNTENGRGGLVVTAIQ